jgi:hypothetical protein
MIYLAPRSRLHIIVFVLLTICTQCFAQNQEDEEFYRLYPDLRGHKEVVQTAHQQLKQEGFQAKTPGLANRAVAIRAYVLLNRSSGAKMPYRRMLEELGRVRSDFPALKDMPLPELASELNKNTNSTAFDEGLNDNWLRRVGANIEASFVNSWGFVIVLTVAGLYLLVIVFRATSRSPKSPAQQDQSPVVGESVWHRAIRPAGIAAKWVSVCVMLSVFRPGQDLSFIQRIGFALVFSVAFALIIALPVYLIAVLSYAMGASRKLAGRSIDISFNCPHCGQHLCVEERGAGMGVKCPGCNEQIEIPRMGIEAQAYPFSMTRSHGRPLTIREGN